MRGNVQYAATKSYLNTFSEGLQDELRGTGVRVQALCPGFTYTEFHDLEQMRGFDRAQVAKRLWMSADDVVKYSLRALQRNRVIAIPGLHNRLLARILRTSWLRPLVQKVAVRRNKRERRCHLALPERDIEFEAADRAGGPRRRLQARFRKATASARRAGRCWSIAPWI